MLVEREAYALCNANSVSYVQPSHKHRENTISCVVHGLCVTRVHKYCYMMFIQFLLKWFDHNARAKELAAGT